MDKNNLVGIKDITGFNSRDLVVYVLENGTLLAYTTLEDTKVLYGEEDIASIGSDGKEYTPTYKEVRDGDDYKLELLGFVQFG